METVKLIRKSFVIQAKPGLVDSYINRHNPIWPELEAVLKAHGVRNYTIFHRPGTNEFFGYCEITDETRFAQLAQQVICQRWWLYMTEVLECDGPDSKKGREEQLSEIFHLA